MKKLMTMIAAVATAFGLYAATTTDASFSFEGTSEAGVTDTTFTPGTGWTWTPATALELLEYKSDAYKYEGKNARRTFAEDPAQVKFLNLKTGTDVLEHEITISDGNVFVDQLVKFTGFDEAVDFTDDTSSKIAVWMSEYEDDNGATRTNLYITAGASKTAVQIGEEGDYELGKWYRLTIKSLGNVLNDDIIVRTGFVVYIDGKEVATDAAKDLIPASDLADKFKAIHAAGKLFPAMNQGAIAAVGYKGIGALDDLTIDNEGPEFAQVVTATVEAAPEGAILTITGGEFTLTGTTLTTAPGTTLTFTWTAKDGYRMADVVKEFTFNGDEKIETPEEVNPEFIIAVVDDESGENGVDCVSVAEAFAAVRDFETKAAQSITVEAKDDIELTSVQDFGSIALAETAYLTITPSSKTWDFAVAAATLITDIAEGATVTAEDITFTYSGKVAGTLTATELVKADGDVLLTGNGSITAQNVDFIKSADQGMKVKKTDNGDDTFTYTLEADTFEVVVPAAAEGTTLKSVVVDGTPEETPEAKTYTAATSVVATYELISGYKWVADDETGVREAYEAATLVAPAAEAIVYTVTVNCDGKNCTATVTPESDVAGKTVEIVLTPAENYEFAAESYEGWEKVGETLTQTYTIVVGENAIEAPAATEKKVEPARPSDIDSGSDDQKKVYDAWKAAQEAAGKTVDPTDPLTVDRSILDMPADATQDALEAKLASIITTDMLNQILANGFDKVDFSELADTYPNAHFEFVVAPEIKAEDGVSGFYRLKASFVPANKQ